MSGPDSDAPAAWAPALADLRPPGGQLHLQDLDTPPTSAVDETWLSPEERERAARFVTAGLRARYRSAHLFMRARLAACTGQHPEALQYTTNAWGKPALRPDAEHAAPVHFNLSHSQHLALLAISPQAPIGADIEMLRTIDRAEMRSMSRTIMTAAEQDAFAALLAQPQDSATPLLAFLTAWTRKEACVKALGLGLSYPVDQVSTGLTPASTQVQLRTPGPGHTDTTVRLQTRVLDGMAVVSIAHVIPQT